MNVARATSLYRIYLLFVLLLHIHKMWHKLNP